MDERGSLSGKSFSDYARTANFVGQDRLIDKLARALSKGQAGRLILQGLKGSGQVRLVGLIAEYLSRPLSIVDGESIMTREEAKKTLQRVGRGLLVVRNADKLTYDADSELLFRTQPTLQDLQEGTCENPWLPIIYLVPPRFSFPYYGRELSFEGYTDEELMRIAAANAESWGVKVTDEQLKEIIATLENSWPKGAIWTPEMLDKHRATRQPGVINDAVEQVVQSGLEAWVLMQRASKPIAKLTSQPKPSLVELGNNVEDVSQFRTLIMRLNGPDFEKLICSLLRGLNFTVNWSSPGRDGGVDIVALSADPLTGGKYLFQCKRYQEQTKIGRPTLQEFVGAAHQHGERPHLAFVTTSSFTSEAKQYAIQNGSAADSV